jgi:hypothetical protein
LPTARAGIVGIAPTTCGIRRTEAAAWAPDILWHGQRVTATPKRRPVELADGLAERGGVGHDHTAS